MCVCRRGATAEMCCLHKPSVEAIPRASTPPGGAAGRSSSTHHPRELRPALPSEHLLMYQDCGCLWSSYQKHQTWPRKVAVCITADWVLWGPPEASVFPQTLLSTSSVGHCVLPSRGSFLSSFLLFFQFPPSFLKNTVPPGQGAHFSLSTVLSYFLLHFWLLLMKTSIKDQQILLIPTWDWNISPPEGLGTE